MDFAELKTKARKTLHKHYWFLVTVCLIGTVLGVAYTGATDVLGAWGTVSGYRMSVVPNGTTWITGIGNVWYMLASGDAEEGSQIADEQKTEAQETELTVFGISIGRTRGVFANILNSVESGSILVAFWTAIRHLAHSDTLANVIFMVLSLGIFLFVRLFILNVYNVIYRRSVLEVRTYESVPVSHFSFLLRYHRWFRTAWTLFMTWVVEVLMGLTVVGAFYAFTAYGMVPYIAAEDPMLTFRETARLSRRMMKGHKLERFRLELSFLGWRLLSVVTFGIGGIFYVNPYHAAVVAEFYAKVRSEAVRNRIEGAEALNDVYLFEKPDDAVLAASYQDAADRSYIPLKKRPGILGFLSEYLGIVLVRGEIERENERAVENNMLLRQKNAVMRGHVYPLRLYPVPEPEAWIRTPKTGYLRHYSLTSLILLFFIFSMTGWVWEVALHMIQTGDFVNRGVLHGPWLPIYGGGALTVLVLLYRFRTRPALEFSLSVLLCGALEYFTSWLLETLHGGTRWWDYSGYFLNLNGRICAEGLLVFGIGAMAAVYLAAPLLDHWLGKVKRAALIALCAVLLTLFAADNIYTARVPNTGTGITDIGKAGPEDSGTRNRKGQVWTGMAVPSCPFRGYMIREPLSYARMSPGSRLICLIKTDQ